MQMAIPANYHDVSQIRQLPDNQEVYTDFRSDQSLIVEIVEPPSEAERDARGAAAWHWDALATDSGATSKNLLWAGAIGAADAAQRAPHLRTCALSLAGGLQTVAKFRDASSAASDVRVHLACVTLPPQYNAHILLSFACPQRLAPEGSSARAGAVAAVSAADAERPAALPFYSALATLEVVRWSLFG